MGSSKKHKEKDREHRRKHKHRSRERSRSVSAERSRKRRDHDDKDSREHHGDEKRRRVDREDEEQMMMANASANSHIDDRSAAHTKQADDNNEDIIGNSSGAALSLSIQQTNELRAKLGLKPLEVDGAGQKDSSGSAEKQDVHKPAENLAQVRKTAQLREKMDVMREKRRVQDTLSKVKTLGADSDDDDTASAWVLKSRKQEEERKQAELRAKMLEEMDAEFGIGGLMEEEFGTKKRALQEYTSRDLKGLTVEHDIGTFKEGKGVILTLKDKGVLDEDDSDTLVNVNIIDDEKAAVNVENKKKKPAYQAYDDSEFDEDGMLKTKEVLDKYDEVIFGQKKQSFQLGDSGRYDTSYERRMKDMTESYRAQSERLELPPLTVASEFYTSAEMEEQAKFKKTTRKARKIRKKAKVTADDLLGLEETVDNDLGSRIPKRYNDEGDAIVKQEQLVVKTEPAVPGFDVVKQEIKEEDAFDDLVDDTAYPDEDLTGVVVDEDAAALELELALNKARKLNQSKFTKRPNDSEIIASLRADIVDSTPDDILSSVTLNSTSEFCRSLGDIPTYGLAGNRDDDEEEEMSEYDRDKANRRDEDDDEDGGGTGWQSVEIDTRPVDIVSLPETSVLEEEPIVKHGLAGALKLAEKKGYLDKETVRKSASLNPKSAAELRAQNYSIEDKKIDEDDKYRKRDRYVASGGMEFREKEGYKPDVKLDYFDDAGQQMSAKEAFRILSHRFHGKGSGKRKTEKRMKKADEERLMRSMSSTDTPLNTVHLLQEKQKADKLPYIILSGGKGGLVSNSLAK